MSRPRVKLDTSLSPLERLLTYPPGTWLEWNYRPCVLVRWSIDQNFIIVRIRGKKNSRRRYTLSYYNPGLRLVL